METGGAEEGPRLKASELLNESLVLIVSSHLYPSNIIIIAIIIEL